MECQQFVELVTDYLEGALPPEDIARFEDHLRACVGCENYMEQMRLTIRIVGRLKESDVSPQARAALLHAFRDWKNVADP